MGLGPLTCTVRPLFRSKSIIKRNFQMWTVEDELTQERSWSLVWWYGSGYLCISWLMAAAWTDWDWGEYCLLVFNGRKDITSPAPLMLSRWVSMMFWAVLVTCCRVFPSLAVHIMPVTQEFALLKKSSCFWALLFRVEMRCPLSLCWWFPGV